MVRTTRGRVVYNREKHNFRWCDLRRIVEKLQRPLGIKEEFCALETGDAILSWAYEAMPEGYRESIADVRAAFAFLAGDMIQSHPEVEFGGAGYGGAGASRDWHWPWEGNPFKV